MTHLDLVKVFDTGQNLMEKSTGFRILKLSLLDDVVEQFAPTCILHDEEKLLGSLNDLVQLNYVWMAHDLENMDLTHDSRNISLILDFVFLKDFNGDLLLRQLMDALSHLSECSRTNLLAYAINRIRGSKSETYQQGSCPQVYC